MKLRDILFPIAALTVGIGAGVAIGWFSKPDDDTNTSSDDSISLINDFMERVTPSRLGENLRKISEKPHYATSVGDYALSQMVKEQWANTLDDAWIVDYQIMHQWPVEANSHARFTVGDEVRILAQKEDTDEEDVIMFYNAYSPPTSFDVDEQGNAVETNIKAKKLVYGHYCSKDNVQELIDIDEDFVRDAIVLCKYTNGGRPDKPSNLKPHGALAVLQFSDPFDYSHTGETGFPDDAGIPWDTVQRGSSKYLRGDPTTPGQPSYPGIYKRSIKELLEFTKNNVDGPHIWAPLPQQPISINDANYLIGQLNGLDAPTAWLNETVLNLTKLGGTIRSGGVFDLQIAPKYERSRSEDVIGFIEGSEFPDEYVMIGNHRDSWVHGTIDPSSGTTTLFELSQVFSDMQYRPKRSIVFLSWGSEEHGLIGSEEFVEEFYWSIRERAVAYINSDVAFEADGYFRALSTPILREFVYETAKLVPHHGTEKKTVYDHWLENDKGTDGKPAIGAGGVGSDYAPLTHLAGLPFVDISVKQNDRPIALYSTYHTAYDNYAYTKQFVDPEWKAAQMVTRMAGVFVMKLAQRDNLAFSAGSTVDMVNEYVDAVDTPMQDLMEPDQIEALKSAADKFNRALEATVSNSQSTRAQKRLLGHNKHLINFESTHPIQVDLKNVLHSPRQESGPTTFPGISNWYQLATNDKKLTDMTKEAKLTEYKKQVSAVIVRLNSAADYLSLSMPFKVRQ